MSGEGWIFRIRRAPLVLVVGVLFCLNASPQTVSEGDRVTSLLKDLQDKDATVRRDAARALGAIGAAAKEAAPALTRALDDTNYEVRYSATDALGKLGPAAEPAVPILIRDMAGTCYRGGGISCLFDSGYSEAVSALVNLGVVAVPALIEALHDKSDERRLKAASTLSKIGPAAVTASPDLIAALRDDSELVRTEAARALGHLWAPPACSFDRYLP